MAEVHFLEHYRYRRFIKTIKESGVFPACPYHQLSVENVLEFFDYLHNERCTFQKIVTNWNSISSFVAFYFQQPVRLQLEMLTPYDFSRFINYFVPIFHPETKRNIQKARDIFDCLYHYFLFLYQTNKIETMEPITAAREQIFRKGKIHSIKRKKLKGPEWAVVLHSPVDGAQLVFTFNDIWLLLALEKLFEGEIPRLRVYLEAPENPIRDQMKKRAHFSRILKKIKFHHLPPDQVIKGLENRSSINRARQWLKSDEFVSTLLDH